jgi:hypothetical protein
LKLARARSKLEGERGGGRVDAGRPAHRRTVADIVWLALLAQAALLLLLRGNLAFAAILVLVAAKFRSDRAWLLVPIIAEGVALLTILAEAVASRPGEGPAVLRPVLTAGVFLACYVLGYIRMGPHEEKRPQRGNTGLGWRFDKWSGR